MQLAITGAELLVLEEKCVVQQRQCVENVELELLGEDQGVVHELVKARLQVGAFVLGRKTVLRGVVEEVGGADLFVRCGGDHGGREDVKGEEVGNVLGRGVLVLR